NLVAGSAIVVRVNALVSASATGSITNGISLRGPGTDPGDTPDDEDDTPPIPVVNVTDLSIVKTVDNYTPFIGSNVVFTLRVTNNGPSDAEGVWVLDELPSGYRFVSANASVGSYNASTGRWVIGDMAKGDVREVNITATVLETGDYINYAQVDGDDDDPDLSNNEDTPDQPVVPQLPPVNLTISKVADEAKVLAGGTTTFTLTIMNNGPAVLRTGSQVRIDE